MRKKSVYFATRLRGFFKYLLDVENENIEFLSNEKNIYEINKALKMKLLPIFRSNIISRLGIIRKIHVSKKLDCDYVGSFNKFLSTRKPYFIYLENPTAPYGYVLGRNKTLLGRNRINKFLNDDNLKAIICMSRACENTINEVLGPISNDTVLTTIYPYIPKNKYISRLLIEEKSKHEKIRYLFIAQGERFISKGGLEVISIFEELKNIELTIISNEKNLDKDILDSIKSNYNINFIEFNLNTDELLKVYSNHHVLLHPTSDDSFGIVILEAIKSGMPVISTKLYAIPEMVRDDYNGYLINPKYYFFNKENIPNKYIWNNRNNTIYKKEIDYIFRNELMQKIMILNNDRELLKKMSFNSLEISDSSEFSCEKIISKWISVIDNIST